MRDQLRALDERMSRAKVLPVLRAPSVREALAQVRLCAEAGLDVIELTTSTPDWPAALAEARANHPERLIGVGTVLTKTDAERAIDHGAGFLVSPCPAAPVRRVAKQQGTEFLEGGMTVREVLSASNRGIAKLFPAHVGGPQFLRSVLALRPGARIVPTGGISLADVPEWLRAGAVAVGIGGGLLSEPDLRAAISDIQQDSLTEP
jgi:2-dehydro-3-deoxyphosphogluconate aldolase/(4S)-4-hydroxy-2-oxoglutarate aldolase